MVELILYGTSACHLCDKAKEVLWSLSHLGISFKEVDIAEQDGLICRYGTRIPVVQMPGCEAELGWPFDGDDVVAFVAKNQGHCP